VAFEVDRAHALAVDDLTVDFGRVGYDQDLCHPSPLFSLPYEARVAGEAGIEVKRR
jgi:hypothetical protein